MGGDGKESVMAEPPRARFRLLSALSDCVKRFCTLPGSRPSRKACCIQRLLYFQFCLAFVVLFLFCFRDHIESCCRQKKSGDAHGMANCRMTPREVRIGAVRHTACSSHCRHLPNLVQDSVPRFPCSWDASCGHSSDCQDPRVC